MGQEISDTCFDQAHFDQFHRRLAAEMVLLRRWFAESKFASDRLQCGLELEAWLVDADGLPAPDNGLFLATLDRKSVVPELSKFNVELNVLPQYAAGPGLRDMQCELNATWARCAEVAARLNHHIVSIGILPTLTDSMLCLENMSQLQRYAALNAEVLRLRQGQPLQMEIQGTDHLQNTHNDLMLESAATSAQVHLKVPQAVAVRYYNASVIASSFTVACAANAPLLFGKRLWDDTRITVFEQAVDTAGPLPRVTFGCGYLTSSLLELFEHNLQHRVLLPVVLEEPTSKIPYIRMHNGTLWNWNRALIGFENDGQPHLRIEHRPMSASPSLQDLMADVAFYLGLTHYLANRPEPPEQQLSFNLARENFYNSARHGLQSQIHWLDGKQHAISGLLISELLPSAMAALAELEVAPDLVYHCNQVMHGRIETRQNGAAWQRRKFSEYGGDLQRLLLEYIARQNSGLPVHTWV